MAFFKRTETPVLHIPRRILDIAAGNGLHPGFAGASIALETHFYFHDDYAIVYYDAAASFTVGDKYVHAGGQFNNLDGVETFLRTGEIDNSSVDCEYRPLAAALEKVEELKKEAADAQPA
jgi:hypothetical protein